MMEYRFQSGASARDLWELSLYRIYHSVGGVCNIVFTIGLILLTLKFWGTANVLVRILMIFGCMLFPIWQPFFIYLNAAAQAEKFPKDVWLEFDQKGIHVTSGEAKENIPWKKVARFAKEPNMFVIYTSKNHGYMLTKRTMGEKMTEFCEYAEKNLKRK